MTNDDGYYGTWGSTTQPHPPVTTGKTSITPLAITRRCYWDSTHIISAYAVYELPFGKGKQFGHDMPDGRERRCRQLVD